MKKLTVLIMSIVLVAVGAIFVFGQTSDSANGDKSFGKRGNNWKQGKRGHRGRGGMGFMFRQLDLTDVQKEQLKSIRQANRESTKSLREQLRANRQQLEQITANGAFDEAQVQAIAQQQGVLRAQMIVAKERAKSQMFAILTPEQKAKAAEMKQQFEQKMQERRRDRREQNKDENTDS